MDNISAIESNLYQFYHFIADKGKLEFHKDPHYSWIRNPGATWPNYVFDIDINLMTDHRFISELAGRMKRKEIPSVIVNREPEDRDQFYHVAEQNGLRKVFEWTGMRVSKNEYINTSLNEEIIPIEEVHDHSSLEKWIGIVNAALFNSKSMNISLLERFYQEPELRLYLGKSGDNMVASTLSFEKGGIGGLYMVSTLLEYRGKGIGTKITNATIDNCFKGGAESIILHSTAIAENIYRRMGFIEYCKFGILWMVGKEFL